MSLQHRLPLFAATSRELWLTVADFAELLGNRRPPWAPYRVLISGRLIALDKHPGFRLVGVGDTWRSLMEKCILRGTGQDAKAACGTEHLAREVEVGIEGGIHDMRLLWAQHSQEEYWGFLPINARNAFN